VNGIGRFTAFEYDLIATKEGGFAAGLQHPPLLQVDHSVEGKRAGDAGDRVDVEVAHLGTAGQACRRLGARAWGERLAPLVIAEAGLTMGVERDG
jgi:hypothetical protein